MLLKKNKSVQQTNIAQPKINNDGLGVWALAAIVVSSMIGGGIYSLPSAYLINIYSKERQESERQNPQISFNNFYYRFSCLYGTVALSCYK